MMSDSRSTPQGEPTHSVAIGHSHSMASCVSPPNGPRSEYFPNVVVVTHENRRALFYDDLLRGKTVMINFMSIEDHARFPVSETIAKVLPHIGPRLGRHVFLYSITSNPVNDTAAALERFAAMHNVQPGWLFLTGAPESIQRIRDSLFSHTPGHDHATMSEDCSLGMIRYGNELAGLWGSVPNAYRPEKIAERISWVESRQAPAGPFKRKGPLPRI